MLIARRRLLHPPLPCLAFLFLCDIFVQKIDVRMGFAFIEFEDRRDAEDAVAGEIMTQAASTYICILLVVRILLWSRSQNITSFLLFV